MTADPADFSPVRFSTDALPTEERVKHWRDFARQIQLRIPDELLLQLAVMAHEVQKALRMSDNLR